MDLRMRMGLTVASAIAVAMCFPPVGLWGLILLAWTPFFIVIRKLRPRHAFYFGFAHGFLSFGIALSWLWELFALGAIALWATIAFFTAAWAWFYSTLERRNVRYTPLLAAILWTALEYFRGELFTLSFPWITPGTGLPPNLMTPIIGTYGISFLIILSSLFLVTPGRRTEISGLAIALTVLFAIGATEEAEKKGEPLKVALVQNEKLSLPYYLEQSAVLQDYVDVFVWPEYALARDPTKTPETEQKILTLLKKRAKLLITGGPTWHSEDKNDWSNTAFTYNQKGLLARHYKNHPVHLFEDGKPNSEAKAIETEFGTIGTPICFDCDHQDVVRRMVSDGAKLFFVPAMNRKEWTDREHRQHAIHARHRAAENGRWIAVSSTSGVTQIIDSCGNVRKKLPLSVQQNLVGEIYFDDKHTFFSKAGWLTGPFLAILGFIFLTYALVWRLKKYFEHRTVRLEDVPKTTSEHPAAPTTDLIPGEDEDDDIEENDKKIRSPRSFYD